MGHHVEAPLWWNGAPATAPGPIIPADTATFSQQLGVSAQETHARIDAIYRQLFHGDGQEQRLYFETGANANGPLAYITDWANNDARSEGMSYGMMIAVQLGHKREFDALWNWSKTYMEVTDPANPSYGYFAWSMNTDGTPRSTGAAPDGEQYYAMALYFAANRWGNGKGIYDYRAQADRILRAMRHRAVKTGTPPFRIHPGARPLFSPTSHGPASTTAPRPPRPGPQVAPGRLSAGRIRLAPPAWGRWWMRATPWCASWPKPRCRAPMPPITCPLFTNCGRAGGRWRIALSGPRRRMSAVTSS
jgi:oligosaccharide reducing-end xylanase